MGPKAGVFRRVAAPPENKPGIKLASTYCCLSASPAAELVNPESRPPGEQASLITKNAGRQTRRQLPAGASSVSQQAGLAGAGETAFRPDRARFFINRRE